MHYQYIPYLWPLLASAFVSFFLGIYAFVKRRSARGALSFILSMAVVTIWSLGNALEMSGTDLQTKLFWANMQYFAYCYSPVTLLIMCLQFTGYDEWIRNKKVWRAAILPTITLLLVWTDEIHGLMRYNLYMDSSGIFPVIMKKYGPVFYIHAAYAHSLNIAAWVLLIRAVFYKSTVYKRQAAALLVGVSMIVIPNVLYIFGVSPIKRFDITPIFFGPAGLFMAWGIFRCKVLDLVPLARTTVIETMSAGIMVLDLQDRVLDVNPAFEKIIGFSASKILSQNVTIVCQKIPELARACIDRNIVYTEFSVSTSKQPVVYEVQFSPLSDKKGMLIGRLAVIYEITAKKQAEEMFLKQQWKLAVVEERERMARDLHDNLGQVLGFINLQGQGVKQELMRAGIETGQKRMDRLIDAAQSAHNEIREYIREARSSVFIEKDFMAALNRDISHFEGIAGIKVQLDIADDVNTYSINPSTRINILYIIKEALNNIYKHAKAKNVKIRFAICFEELYITVEDDGQGFSAEGDIAKPRSFGLKIMKERALEIGGRLDIKSSLGKGSLITLGLNVAEGGEKRHENSASG